MIKAITGLDHVGIDPNDVWQAFAKFSRLGFTVSTPSRFFGLPVESCQVTFPGIFLSISTTFTDPARLDTQWIAKTKPVGITELMFGTQDIQRLKNELASNDAGILEGHAQADPIRKVHSGSRDFQQQFLILVLDPARVQGVGNIGFCQHATPENVFRAELMSHPNSAVTLSGVTFVHESPASLKPFYDRLLGPSAEPTGKSSYGRMIGDVSLEFVTHELLHSRFPEFTAWEQTRAPDLKVVQFGVEDIEKTRAYFEFMGISYFTRGTTLYVRPADACGFLLGFEGILH